MNRDGTDRKAIVTNATSPTASSWRWTRVGLLPAFLFLGGCADAGAPSFTLFGAFFPAWMLCAAIGIVGAGLARAFFVGTGLAAVLPYQLLVCTALGTVMALAAWFLAFGE